MDYTSIFITLASGILFLSYPELLLPVRDRINEKKVKLLKRLGYIFIALAFAYFMMGLMKQ